MRSPDLEAGMEQIERLARGEKPFGTIVSTTGPHKELATE